MTVEVDTRSLAVLRARARAPRIALTASAAVLSVVGTRSLIAPAPVAVRPTTTPVARIDLAGRWAAERAARALVAGTDSRVVADEPSSAGRRLVTVAVTGPLRVDVAVLIGISRDGGSVVYGPPAIVGGPAVTTTTATDSGQEVDDPRLLAVVSRLLANYVQGEASNVAADLAPGVRAAVPRPGLSPRPVDAVTWITPGRRVAALLSARLPSGDLVDLRYELGVARLAGRWVITALESNPTHLEVRP